jgi:hypothetical protein
LLLGDEIGALTGNGKVSLEKNPALSVGYGDKDFEFSGNIEGADADSKFIKLGQGKGVLSGNECLWIFDC